jgi:uncharacterized membrane protein (DUF485 family)
MPHLLTRLSDILTALAYFSIPIEIAYFSSKARLTKDLTPIVTLFVLFIAACGTTHVLSAVYADKAHMYPPLPVLVSRGITGASHDGGWFVDLTLC